jgi:hypothetical protein
LDKRDDPEAILIPQRGIFSFVKFSSADRSSTRILPQVGKQKSRHDGGLTVTT